MTQPDVSGILERIDSLQRRNTRLTVACMALCAIVVGTIGFGMKAQHPVQGEGAAGQADDAPAGAKIEIHDFTLVDSQMRPRLRLTAQSGAIGGPAVELLGEDGMVRAALQLEGDKPTMRLNDAAGQPRVQLITEGNDAWLKLFDQHEARKVYAYAGDDRSGLELLSPELGKVLLESNLGGFGPMMTVWDQNGQRRVWIGGTMVGPSLMLYDKEGALMWSPQKQE